MSSEKPASAGRHMPHRLQCRTCALAANCLPANIEPAELDVIEPYIVRGAPLQRGECVYRAGAPFTALYIVRSGAVRTYIEPAQGDMRIVGFHLPAEFLGLDGPSHAASESTAVALETTAVCALPYGRLVPLRPRLPTLQVHLLRAMSRAIHDDRHLLLLLGRRTAEARVASFLLAMSERNARRKLSPLHFHLPMPRADIANFLGLVIETTSRVFTRLHRTRVIELDKRDVRIADLARLRALANGVADADGARAPAPATASAIAPAIAPATVPARSHAPKDVACT